MTRKDINRIASEYFDDKESEHEMDEVFDLAKKALEEREEAIERLRGILTEAVEFENSVCYVTEEDREPLEMAIKALERESCEDAISRQAVLDAIDAKAWEFCDYLIRNGRNDEQKPVSHFADNLRECVREELPPVNPQVKTGHWIEERNDYGEVTGWHCDKCYEDSGFTTTCKWDFCPSCGAMMIEPQESEVSDADSD